MERIVGGGRDRGGDHASVRAERAAEKEDGAVLSAVRAERQRTRREMGKGVKIARREAAEDAAGY